MRFLDIIRIVEIESKVGSEKELFCIFVFVIGGGRRFGIVLVFKSFFVFIEEDIIVFEYVLIVIGFEFLNFLKEEDEEEKKKREMIKFVIEIFFVFEFEVFVYIFDELKGNEGFLVVSRVVDKVGIIWFVIVNVFRKFESVGFIEIRLFGFKGIYIKVLNEMVRDEIEK